MAIEKILLDTYEFLENGDELGISFKLDGGEVSTAELVYDGGNCAILIRNNTQAFLFVNILPQLRQKLLNIPEVMIIEEEEGSDEIVNSYMVNVEKVDEIPFEDTLTDDLLELINDLRDVYGDEGVERIAKEAWDVK